MLRSHLESTRRSLTDGLFIMPAAGLLMLALALPSMAQEFVNVTHGRAQFWSFSQGMVAQDFDQTADFASASLVSDDGESTATVTAQGSVAGATTMMVDTSLDRSSVNIAVGKASIHLYRPLAFGPFEYGSEFEVTLNGSITGTATGDEVGPLTFASEFFSERVTQAGFRLFNEIGFAVPGIVSGSGLHGGGVVDGTSDVLLTGIHDPIDESFDSTWLIRVPFPDEVGFPDDFQFGPLWLNSRLDTLFGTVNAGTEVDAAISVTLTTDLDILPPIADAGGPYVVTSGETVTLDASGTSGDIEVFEWDFDFGESFDVDATGQFPVFDASGIEAPAQRNIALRVRDVNNLTALDTTLLTIEPPEVFEWINTQGGSFENGDNWSGGEKPGSQNTAHFNAPGSYTVDVGTETVDRLIIGGDPSFNVTIQTLLLQAGSTSQDEPSIQVNNGHFTLGGGFLTGNHMVIGTSAATNVTVTGSGGVSGTLGLTGRLAVGGGGEALLTVENGGSVLSQESLIGNAENGAPGRVVLDGLGSSWNAGALVVGTTSEGSLEILAGGEVQADSVHIGSEITPGRLTVQGTVGTENSTLNVTNDLIVGEIGSQSELRVLEGGRVFGGGSLNVFFNSTVVVDSAGEGESVLSADSGLIIGNFSSMTIRNGGLFLTAGTADIGFAGPGDLLVDGDQSAFFAKQLEVGHGETPGTVTAANSGSVLIDSTLLIHEEGTLNTPTGSVAVGGSFIPSDLLDGQVLVAENGTVAGTGTIKAALDNIGGVNNFAGTVAPGASPGILTIEGNYTQGPAGTLEIEIAGTTSGEEHDQLVVTGDAVVEGNVVLKFMNGFAPTAGQEFGTLLDVRGAPDTDEADFIVQNLTSDFEFDITPLANGFMLTAMNDGTFREAIDGDYDNSGQVEQADLDLVLLNWGASATPIPDGWINDLPTETSIKTNSTRCCSAGARRRRC